MLFPSLKSVWGYVGTSPNGAEDNKGETSSEHILAWLAGTQEGKLGLMAAARRMRSAEVLQGTDIYRLHDFKGDR